MTQNLAPVVGDSLYVWAGDQPDLPSVHDSPHKRQITSTINILHLPSGQWTSQLTRGTPPPGVIGYSCTVINSNIYYFGGWCGHDSCYYNNITCLDTLTLKWSQVQANDDSVMKRGYGGMMAVDYGTGQHHLLTVGGQGSPPTVPHPQHQYVQLSDGSVRTNEVNLFDLSSGKSSSVH